jgi:TPR repeat protein
MTLAAYFFRLFVFLFAVFTLVPSLACAGMTPDEVKVFERDKDLAIGGDPVGQCNLGFCYKTGSGVKQDMAEGVKWYRKAAEQGLAQAQFNLGDSYYRGTGIAKDLGEAVKWLRKAADQGHASAQINLGNCYANGEGLTKDYRLAFKLYREAAEQGDAGGLCNLGDCYRKGEGVAKDEIEAYACFNLAAIDDVLARSKRIILEEKMSPDARILGQQRTKELQKEIEAKIAARKAGK